MPYKDPEKRREAFKKYYEKNKEKVLEKNRQWWVDNPERAREINARSHRKMRGMDVEPINPEMCDEMDDVLDHLVPIPDLPEAEPVKSEPPVIEDSYGLDDLLRALKEETE